MEYGAIGEQIHPYLSFQPQDSSLTEPDALHVDCSSELTECLAMEAALAEAHKHAGWLQLAEVH